MLTDCYRTCLLLSVLVGAAIFVQARADTIHAGVNPVDGHLRVVSEADQCNPGENALAWSTALGRATAAEKAQTSAGFAEINAYLE
jgi:hypothetical protein